MAVSFVTGPAYPLPWLSWAWELFLLHYCYTNITPHLATLHHTLATHCLWNAVVTATTFDCYYLLSRAVWLRVSNTSPDGGAAPSSLSPPGRSRCHLVRETDDRNGFISALRRLCNVITLMWFILAFRHADHRPAPASTRHFYCSQDTAINTRQADQTIISNLMNLTFCFEVFKKVKGKSEVSEATGKKSVTRCKSSEQSHHLHITSSRVGNYKYFTPRSQRCWENSDQAVMTTQLKEGLVTWSQGEDCVEQCSN